MIFTKASNDNDDRMLTCTVGTNVLSITNDENGNMTWGPLTNAVLSTYTYDARNRLTSAGGLSYGYDAINNRVAVTNGTNAIKFVIEPKTSQVLMRIKPNGTTNYYVYGPGLLYEVDETATTTNTATYHYDMRGSTVALTDTNGIVTDQMQYSAYGTLLARNGTNDTPFLYNGRYGVQTDPNGLLYMRARYYNPYICRFINADPSGFNGGLNFYAFANGNPISLNDPFGLDTQFTVGVGLTVGLGWGFPAPLFGGGGGSVGITTSGQIIIQFQDNGMTGGTGGAFAGVGLQAGISSSDSPTPDGLSTVFADHTEFNAGFGPAFGMSGDRSSDGGDINFPIPKVLDLGAGVGWMNASGTSMTTTYAFSFVPYLPNNSGVGFTYTPTSNVNAAPNTVTGSKPNK